MYKDIRDELKTWDIIIYNNNTFFWKVIRKVTWEKATHVAIAIWLWPRLFIIESIEGKWVIMTLASVRLKKWHIVKVRRKIKKLRMETIINRATCKLWDKYDWWINFWLLLKKVFWVKVQINYADRYNCSEFGAYVLKLDREYVSPWDLLRSRELKNIT